MTIYRGARGGGGGGANRNTHLLISLSAFVMGPLRNDAAVNVCQKSVLREIFHFFQRATIFDP